MRICTAVYLYTRTRLVYKQLKKTRKKEKRKQKKRHTHTQTHTFAFLTEWRRDGRTKTVREERVGFQPSREKRRQTEQQFENNNKGKEKNHKEPKHTGYNFNNRKELLFGVCALEEDCEKKRRTPKQECFEYILGEREGKEGRGRRGRRKTKEYHTHTHTHTPRAH